MRLVARVEDQFTGPLAKLKHEIVGVSDTTKKHTSAWRKDWDEARGGITRFEGALNGVTPVLTRLGVSGIGVALSIGGMASALGEFSLKTRGLSQTSKDIGLTVDQLRAFNALGERFGVTADTMTSAAKSFAGQMYEIKRQGSTYVELQAMNLAKLAEDLASSKSMEQAIQRGMEGLRAIPDSEVRRRVSRLLFGTDDIGLIASNLTGTVKGALGEVSQAIGKMDKDTEQAAKDFQKHMNHISEAAERARLKFIGPLLESMVGAVDFIEKRGLFGQDKNAPSQSPPTDLDESLDAQMRGQRPLSKSEKERQNRADTAARELAQKSGELDYARKRIVREPEVERRLTAEIQRLTDELRRLREQGATLNPSSFGGPAGGGSLIQKAAWGGGGFGRFGGGPLSGYGGGGSGSFGGPLGNSGGSGPLGNGGTTSLRAPVPYQGAISGQRGGVPEGQDGPLAAKYPDGLAAGIRQTAKDLGVSAEDIATVLSYETGGTFDKWKRGPTTKWGTHRGLIQWGEPQAQKYGVTADMSAGEQMRAVTRYLRDAGVKPGMGILDIYSAVNAGRVGRYNASDAAAGGAWGTVRDKVEHQMHGHRRKAAALLRTDLDGDVAASAPGEADVPWHQRLRSNEPGKMSRLRDDELEVPGSGERPGDRMMRRFYGEGAPVAKGGKGSLHITLEGFPPGSKAKASMDDLFRDTKVERGRSQMDMT